MNFDLFTTSDTCHKLSIPDAECTLYPNFFDNTKADKYFTQLTNAIQWSQETILMYGKKMNVPRLSAWYGDHGLSYEYSGIKKVTLPWNTALMSIKNKIESVTNISFNSVLVNLYRNGNDSVDWHSDDEPELGMDPIIASISLGEERQFQMKNKKDKTLKQSFVLPHGSLLLMCGQTQKNWMHKIPKSTRVKGPRINLTFRTIIQ